MNHIQKNLKNTLPTIKVIIRCVGDKFIKPFKSSFGEDVVYSIVLIE